MTWQSGISKSSIEDTEIVDYADKYSRSDFHTATNDYDGKRQGNRVVSLGEKPYYNPASKSRREALYGGLYMGVINLGI